MKRIIVNTVKTIVPYKIRLKLRKVNWGLRYMLQKSRTKGTARVYCPIAEKEFDCFIPEQKGVWSSLITPSNGARSRHRLIWLYLKNETGLFQQPSSLVHIAPEHCFFERLREMNRIDYLPGDKMVDGYGKQSGVQYMDLLDTRLEDNSKDYLLCNHVLEHIPDDIAAMKEIYRILKPQGVGIITVPIDESLQKTYEDPAITSPEEREKHFGQWDHVRWYATDIKQRFEDIGFKAELIRYGDRFSPKEYERYGLCDDLIIRVVK